jgi:hypothetical protein
VDVPGRPAKQKFVREGDCLPGLGAQATLFMYREIGVDVAVNTQTCWASQSGSELSVKSVGGESLFSVCECVCVQLLPSRNEFWIKESAFVSRVGVQKQLSKLELVLSHWAPFLGSPHFSPSSPFPLPALPHLEFHRETEAAHRISHTLLLLPSAL